MLSRTADSLFWTGRYIERADYLARILEATLRLAAIPTREGASVIVRGLRAVADFEYEYQMAGMNQQLNDRIETVFLMADVGLQPIASRLVKEIAIFGGDIHKFVTPAVRDAVTARIAERGLRQGEA